MTNVTLTVHSNGDGYLTVDTDDWVRDRMTRDDGLTESLREWLRSRGDEPYRDTDGSPIASDWSGAIYPTANRIARWAWFTQKGAPEPGPLWCADYYPTAGSMATFNEGDQVLSDEIGAVWFPTDDGIIFVHQSSGAYGEYEEPTVYRVTCSDDCLAEYDRAQAWCEGEHAFYVYGGVTLEPWDSTYRGGKVGELSRTAFGGARQWVACPECSRALRFDMPAY